MVEHIPSAEEQDWLLESLADLVACAGPGPLVASPILEPTEEYFPEPWAPEIAGIEILMRRLLRYAGLPSDRVIVEVPEEVDDDAPVVWFEGWEGDVCRFGTVPETPSEAERVVEAGCYAVASAYRARHGVQRNDVDEGPRVEVTAAFLGFGILVANAAHKFRKSGYIEGNLAFTSWSHTRLGFLPPQARSFLLAVQCLARGADRSGRRRVAGHLETNQAAFFRKSLDALEGRDVAAELRLPPRASWPAPAALETLTAPLDGAARTVEAAPRARRLRNQGRITFRVKRTRARSMGMLGVVIAAGLLMLVAGAVQVPWWVVVALLGAGLGAGLAMGRTLRIDECSDPECTARLPIQVTTCPRCAGRIMGTIDSPSDRLEAEEALERRPPGGYRDAPEPRNDHE